MRAPVLLLTLIAPLAAVAAPTEGEVGRRIAVMEVGSRPPTARNPLSVLAASEKPPVLFPSLLPLGGDERIEETPADADNYDSLLNARWYHILRLQEQLDDTPEWTIMTSSPVVRPALPLRER